MKNNNLYYSLLALIFMNMTLLNCTPKESKDSAYYSLEDFSRVEKYDVHVHLMSFDTAFVAQSVKDNFKLLSINVDVPSYPSLEDQQQYALQQINAYPDNVHYATAFTVKNWEDENWDIKSLEYLKDSFSKGAIAIKVWKNIGMELKDKRGDFVMIDNPRFDTIFNYLGQNDITLIGHLGEPKNCWLPIEEMTVSGDKSYFARHPEYHMYLHPEYPSYEDQLEARDNILKKYPNLRFVGAHLGSLEWSVDALAEQFDKYPNFAVDMAARISHLQYQAVTDWQKVHDFMIKYQDRIIYGTDLEAELESSPAALAQEAHEIRKQDWRFFTSEDTMTVSAVEDKFKGLRLPKEVVNKIYSENAKRWFPGL